MRCEFQGSFQSCVVFHAGILFSAEDWQQLIRFGKAHGWSTLLCHNHTYPRRPVIQKIPTVNVDWFDNQTVLSCYNYIAIRSSTQYLSGNPVHLEIRVWVHLIGKINSVRFATNGKKINHKRQSFMLALAEYLRIMAVNEAKPKLTLFRMQNWSVSMILGSGLAFYSTSAF